MRKTVGGKLLEKYSQPVRTHGYVPDSGNVERAHQRLSGEDIGGEIVPIFGSRDFLGQKEVVVEPFLFQKGLAIPLK